MQEAGDPIRDREEQRETWKTCPPEDRSRSLFDQRQKGGRDRVKQPRQELQSRLQRQS